MICPQCKCEYIRGVTQCADCGVALVHELESQHVTSFDGVTIVPVWRGKDAGEFERVQQALESAGVLFTTPDSKTSLFVPADPQMEIWVGEADQKAAEKIILEIEGLANTGELTPEQIESLALPESDAPQDDVDDVGVDSDLGQEWEEDEPLLEVWIGEGEEVADSLIACLREIGVAARKAQDAAGWHVLVRPAQEKRAREIVREVVDAAPPE